MSPIAKTAASLACFAAVALAAPALSRRGETDCAPGKVFYSCANGYRGCFEQDPCALPPVATTSIPVTFITTPTATPTPTPSACSTGKIWQPTMYNLYPGEPDKAEDASSDINVGTDGDAPEVRQAIVFHGIPSSATKCTLSWSQAAENERHFTVDGSGFTAAQALSGFPDESSPVSYSSVDAFLAADAKTFHPDFTFWDKQSKDAFNHPGGDFDCTSDMYFKLSLNATANGAGHVYFEQDTKNGFYINYEC
ncbi:uncharacterized protein F4822DRAFT_411150 [Hypoxylon trugodes]|uniref:uncharacterized protein n=1 Tax=Hypoxylon trugodes TaxID=326681 RepID=UPI00219E1CFD|nr:uncharacterized protein F4822DRAFT_411150 [Hypoxylon trugodes]KAI1386760.1 hypothetical protein F4822DRAFT_411150 [Hypoxylon trugodes]